MSNDIVRLTGELQVQKLRELRNSGCRGSARDLANSVGFGRGLNLCVSWSFGPKCALNQLYVTIGKFRIQSVLNFLHASQWIIGAGIVSPTNQSKLLSEVFVSTKWCGETGRVSNFQFKVVVAGDGRNVIYD